MLQAKQKIKTKTTTNNYPKSMNTDNKIIMNNCDPQKTEDKRFTHIVQEKSCIVRV